MDEEVKISILNSFELMPYSMGVVFSFTVFAGIIGSIMLTHQMYWSQKLNLCWCTNNMIFKEQKADEILNKAEAVDGEDEE